MCWGPGAVVAALMAHDGRVLGDLLPNTGATWLYGPLSARGQRLSWGRNLTSINGGLSALSLDEPSGYGIEKG